MPKNIAPKKQLNHPPPPPPHFHDDSNNGVKSYTGLKSSVLHLPNSFFDTMNYRSKLTFGPPPHFCNDTNNSIKSCAGIL